MSLDSQIYFFFFVIVCAVHFRLAPRFRSAWLLLASYVFYFIGNPKFFYLIPTSTLISYLAARAMRSHPERKRWLLTAAVAFQLALLLIYKYSEAVFEPLNMYFNTHLPVLKFFYPLGIAFYTLQIIGYLIDVEREEIEPERDVVTYALFVSFFPLQIAGPIERARRLIPQLKELKPFDRERFKDSATLIYGGLFKKIVLADLLAQFVIPVFQAPRTHTGAVLFMAALVARYRLFCDFSGYTDIARGSAGILGIDLMRNFRRPFRATSITDFWQRWHISLSSWMRDYVYYSLVLSWVGRLGVYACVLATFTLLGLWHAGTACFLLFGLLQGLLIISHDASAKLRARWNTWTGISKYPRAHRAWQVVITFVVFAGLPMVLFSSRSLADAGYAYDTIFTGWWIDPSKWFDLSFLYASLDWKIWPLGALILGLEIASGGVKDNRFSEAHSPFGAWLREKPKLLTWFILIAMGLLIVAASLEFKKTDFIYTKF